MPILMASETFYLLSDEEMRREIFAKALRTCRNCFVRLWRLRHPRTRRLLLETRGARESGVGGVNANLSLRPREPGVGMSSSSERVRAPFVPPGLMGETRRAELFPQDLGVSILPFCPRREALQRALAGWEGC